MNTIVHPTSLPCCKNLRDRPKPGADVARRANLQKNAERLEKYSEGFSYNRIPCPRCRYNLKEVNLLSRSAEVDYNDVICEHCKKKAQFSKVCAKCDNAIARIVSGKEGRDEDTKARLKLWLSKVQRELKEILESTRGVGAGARALKKHVFSETYLGGLYGRLHSPISPRKPHVTQLLDSGLHRRLQRSATAAGRHVPHSAPQRSNSVISMPDFGECIHVPECIEKWAETIEATKGIRAGPGSDQSDLFGDMQLHEKEYKRPSRRPLKSKFEEGEDFGGKHRGAKSHDDEDEHAAKADRRLQKDGANIERDKDKDQDFKRTQIKRIGDLDSSLTKAREVEHDSEKKKTGRDLYDYEKTKTGRDQKDSEKTKTGKDQFDTEKTKTGKGEYDTTKSKEGKGQKKEEGGSAAIKAQTKVRGDKTNDETEDDKTKTLKSQTKQDKYKIESKHTGTDQGPKIKAEKVHKEAGKQSAHKNDEKTSKGGDKGKDKSELDSKGGKSIGKPSPEPERSPKKGKDQPSQEDKEFLRTIQLAKEEKAKAKLAAAAEAKKKEDAKKLAEMNKQQPKLKSIKAYTQKPADIISPSDRALDALNVTVKTEEVTKIIVGQKIFKVKTPRVPLEERDKEKEKEQAPVLFKTKTTLTGIHEGKGDAVTNSPRAGGAGGADGGGGADKQTDRKDAKTKKQDKLNAASEPENQAGITRYALSDRTFIDKGWTQLPTEKVVRKMNVYRMRPAHPEFDWFARNKNKRLVEYDTGEKMAEIDDNGRGRWYYRNGRVALDYYDAEELNAQQRFVLFSSGEPDERGRSHPLTVLGTFDYLGNGVVFDHSGKIRLKYNQTEGVVLDRSLGPVSHWKWHSLNDPPVLQQVMIDTQLPNKDPDIARLATPADRRPRQDNEEMLAIEFDNFIKEKSKKLTQKFKPFQIKMKALKINENFSLRVLDQASIYLIFRDGTTNLKLNMGMILDHQEIVDTDTAELGDVACSAERKPARTDSLAQLQRSVAHAQAVERARLTREHRLRPLAEPAASADRLTAAAARPLRRPLRTLPAPTAPTALPGDEAACSEAPAEVIECRYLSRKPCRNNIYYRNTLL